TATNKRSNREAAPEDTGWKHGPFTLSGDRPPASLTMWQKDGETINNIWERFKVKEAGLRIENVVKEDSGQYICRGTNGFGTVSINFTLRVIDESDPPVIEPQVPSSGEDVVLERGGEAPPVFSQPERMEKRSLTRPMRSIVRLRCKASGKPKPNIMWYKDGKIMPEKDLGLEDSKRAWVLRLVNVQEEDSGEYMCLVFNKHGRINATYMLEVIEPFTERPDFFGEHPVNTTVEYGGTTSFQCRVKSDVKPHIQWLKRVEPHNAYLYVNATIDMHGDKYVVIRTGDALSRPGGLYMNKLVIPHATEEDAGMYICLGANVIGFRFKSAFLEVLPDPNKNTLSEENASEQIDRALSTQAKLVLIVAVPLTFALLFVVVVFACTYNLNHSQGQSRQRQSLQRTCPHPDKDYEDKLQKNISYHHNFTRTSGSSPYLGPEPSESEHSALTCSHSNLPSGGYKTSSDKVFGRYVDMPFHPPSLYSDTTLNSQRSLSNGRVLSLSNQHHLVTC
ncbi:fibroblast growth factor receptor-like protein precursor, partial [Apostichopus japonicus]